MISQCDCTMDCWECALLTLGCLETMCPFRSFPKWQSCHIGVMSHSHQENPSKVFHWCFKNVYIQTCNMLSVNTCVATSTSPVGMCSVHLGRLESCDPGGFPEQLAGYQWHHFTLAQVLHLLMSNWRYIMMSRVLNPPLSFSSSMCKE